MTEEDAQPGFGCLVLLLATMGIVIGLGSWFAGAIQRHPESVASGVLCGLPAIIIALWPSRRRET